MNAYFICVIVRFQMWCVYAQSLDDQTQKYFWVFYLFCKCLCLSLVFWKFFQKTKSVLLKNSFVSIFSSASQVRFLTTKLRKCGSEFSILLKFYTESLTTPSWVIREIWLPAKFALCKWGFSRVTLESYASHYPVKWRKFNFYRAHSDSFSNVLFCPPRASLSPNHNFLSKLNQNFLDFISKTSLRYFFLTLFVF